MIATTARRPVASSGSYLKNRDFRLYRSAMTSPF